MRLPARRLVVRSFRWVRSRALGGVLVLGYHRLGRADEDPLDLAVPRDDFSAHLDIVARCARPMKFSEAAEALAERRVPPRAVVVTFDDGYEDTLDDVLPLLERNGVPATVFVTPGCRGAHFWWDDLASILLEPRRLPGRVALEIRGVTRTWSFPDVDAHSLGRRTRERRGALRSLAAELRVLGVEERTNLLARLREWSGCGGSSRPTRRSLTPNEIGRLAASPLVEIGAHTMSHPVLPALPVQQQREEIAQSRAELESITGRRVTSFSYPHGEYSDSTRRAVSDAGFNAACSSTPDVATVASDPFALPRLWTQPHDGGSFERWLNRWVTN